MALLHTTHKQPELIRSVSYPRRTHGTLPAHPKRATAGASKNYGRFFVMVFALGIAGFWFLAPGPGSTPQTLGASAQETQQNTKPEPEPIKPLDFTVMNTEIDNVIKKYPSMDIGVSVIDIKTGEVSSHGVDEPFVAASTAKLLTAIAYLHDVESGSNTLSEQVGTHSAQAALEAMIVESDNQAWHDFNNSVMSHADLAQYASTVGFSNYDPDVNTVMPSSLAKLLSNLYQRRLLNEEHTKLLLSYMERAKEVEYITSIVPTGVKVYHKPGYLNDRVHDAAILDNGDRPYVLVIFTKSRTNSYNATSGVDIFQSIANSTFKTFLNK